MCVGEKFVQILIRLVEAVNHSGAIVLDRKSKSNLTQSHPPTLPPTHTPTTSITTTQIPLD